jgi:hypothetical protein
MENPEGSSASSRQTSLRQRRSGPARLRVGTGWPLCCHRDRAACIEFRLCRAPMPGSRAPRSLEPLALSVLSLLHLRSSSSVVPNRRRRSVARRSHVGLVGSVGRAPLETLPSRERIRTRSHAPMGSTRKTQPTLRVVLLHGGQSERPSARLATSVRGDE